MSSMAIPPASGAFGNVFGAFFGAYTDEEKKQIWQNYLTTYGYYTPPASPPSPNDPAYGEYVARLNELANYAQTVFVRDQGMYNLSPEEVAKRNIMFLIWDLSFLMLKTVQNSLAVSSQSVIYNSKLQEMYTRILTRIPIYTSASDQGTVSNIASAFKLGYDNLSLEDVANYMTASAVGTTFQLSGEHDAAILQQADITKYGSSRDISTGAGITTGTFGGNSGGLVWGNSPYEFYVEAEYARSGPTNYRDFGAYRGWVAPILTLNNSSDGKTYISIQFQIQRNGYYNGSVYHEATPINLKPTIITDLSGSRLEWVPTTSNTAFTIALGSVTTVDPKLSADQNAKALSDEIIKGLTTVIPTGSTEPLMEKNATTGAWELTPTATVHMANDGSGFPPWVADDSDAESDWTLMLQAKEQSKLVQCSPFSIQQFYQEAYPNPRNDFGTDRITGATKANTAAQTARGEVNAKLQQYMENIRSKRTVLSNQAQTLQTNLSQTQQAVTQQSDLLTSILESMKSIIQSIFR